MKKWKMTIHPSNRWSHEHREWNYDQLWKWYWNNKILSRLPEKFFFKYYKNIIDHIHWGMDYWWLPFNVGHNWRYNQRFPWPGYWETLKDPFYRNIYFTNSATNRDWLVKVYQYGIRTKNSIRVWWSRKQKQTTA